MVSNLQIKKASEGFTSDIERFCRTDQLFQTHRRALGAK